MEFGEAPNVAVIPETKPITKTKITAISAFGAVALTLCAAALAIEISLPYRISPSHYMLWVWTIRLTWAGLIMAALSLGLGIALGSRRAQIMGLAGLGIVLLGTGGVHSGPNPTTWCFNNLRKIDAAKEILANSNGLTNGTPIILSQIFPYPTSGDRGLECAKHGKYLLGAIGTDPRCSVHGSISEIETGWHPRVLPRKENQPPQQH